MRNDPEQLLQRAMESLDRFCVVLIQERLHESVAYLNYVTGWQQVGGWGWVGGGGLGWRGGLGSC